MLCADALNWEAQQTEPQHSGTQVTLTYIIWYTAYSICILSNSDGSKKLPDDGRLLPKYVGACILNKGVVQFNA
jgi:hypothetical protein